MNKVDMLLTAAKITWMEVIGDCMRKLQGFESIPDLDSGVCRVLRATCLKDVQPCSDGTHHMRNRPLHHLQKLERI